jgi:threonyl-tRNA synthetase
MKPKLAINDIIKSMEHDKLYKIRHSLAHLLAAAVTELYPDTKVTLGPPVDNGFYYDMEFLNPISNKDLPKIEKRMKRLLTTWKSFEEEVVTPDKARECFSGNPYKLELIDEIEKTGDTITLYTSGNFTDLCRGGHVENPQQEIKPDTFKLDKVAGAYWRGDEKNTMLTRIYGFAFETKEELEKHLEMLEMAKERDHRKLGKELDLFTFSELVGPGLPLFTPKGTLFRDLIIEKIQNIQKDFGYQKVTIPHITKKDLYETSGHWDKFGDDLFKVKGSGDTEFVMKPMNCPHHTQIFASQMRSYKDLPLRYMESTMVYRDEQAGELLGISRVRSITQDDGHVFCTNEQMEQEVKNIISVIKEFYTSLGMLNEGEYWVSLSVRDPKTPEKYMGDSKVWDTAEEALEKIAKEADLDYKRVEGEAAFYGPKIDFQFKDALGREWQLGTAQLDFQMPERFSLEYTDSNGDKKTPVMIHRAVAGSLERFMAVAIEHFAGAFPFWLSPVQYAVFPVNKDAHGEYARETHKALEKAGFRGTYIDDGNLGKRLRDAKMQKIPYILILGDEEISSKTITAEGRGDEKLKKLSIEELLKHFHSLEK